jgi:hypothetical protein
MNNLAISPYIGMHILQLQNIKRNYTSSYLTEPKTKPDSEPEQEILTTKETNNIDI